LIEIIAGILSSMDVVSSQTVQTLVDTPHGWSEGLYGEVGNEQIYFATVVVVNHSLKVGLYGTTDVKE